MEANWRNGDRQRVLHDVAEHEKLGGAKCEDASVCISNRSTRSERGR